VWQLTLLRLLQGALAGTVTASTALVASVAPRERSGYVLGMMHAANFLGASLGPMLGGLLADHLGYRVAFLAAGLLLSTGGVWIAIAVKEDFTPARSLPKEQRGSFGEVFAAVGFLSAVFALLAVRFAHAAASPVFPLLVEKVRGSSEDVNTVAGGIFAAGGIAAAVTGAFLSQFSDAWGHRRLLMTFALFAAAVSVLHVPAQSVSHLLVLRILFGVGAGAMMPAANAIIRNVTRDRNIGKAFGVMSSLTAAGWSLGPLAGGYVAASMGLRAPFVMMATVFVLSALLVVWRIKPDNPGVSQSSGGDEPLLPFATRRRPSGREGC